MDKGDEKLPEGHDNREEQLMNSINRMLSSLEILIQRLLLDQEALHMRVQDTAKKLDTLEDLVKSASKSVKMLRSSKSRQEERHVERRDVGLNTSAEMLNVDNKPRFSGAEPTVATTLILNALTSQEKLKSVSSDTLAQDADSVIENSKHLNGTDRIIACQTSPSLDTKTENIEAITDKYSCLHPEIFAENVSAHDCFAETAAWLFGVPVCSEPCTQLVEQKKNSDPCHTFFCQAMPEESQSEDVYQECDTVMEKTEQELEVQEAPEKMDREDGDSASETELQTAEEYIDSRMSSNTETECLHSGLFDNPRIDKNGFSKLKKELLDKSEFVFGKVLNADEKSSRL